MLKAFTTRDRAAELEQEATRYPDERGEILLEAASAWKDAGELKRAVAVLREVVSLGGQDAGYARYSLADLFFGQGRDAEAWEHLRAFEAEAAPDAGPCGLVGELLAERGERVRIKLHAFSGGNRRPRRRCAGRTAILHMTRGLGPARPR